jgi:hypothetical protein
VTGALDGPSPNKLDARGQTSLLTLTSSRASRIGDLAHRAYGLVVPDVKSGHGLTRVLSFPSPSGWRDQMTAFIGRREFITLLGGAAATSTVWPLTAHGQRGRLPQIGLIQPSSRLPENYRAFRDGLRDLGYVEGQNIALDMRAHRRRPQ